MRAYLNAAVLSAGATGLAVLGLRAPDPLVAIAAIAAGTCLLAWLAAQASTTQESGLALANPAWALTLAVQQRLAWTQLLPLWAGHVVGAIAAGFGAALNLVTLVGLGIAGFVSWPLAAILAAAVLAGAGAAGASASMFVAADDVPGERVRLNM